MPIYAYKCGSCGHAKDVLRKLSDEPLTVCPACGAATFTKQVTAAGFKLQGSGWYATDFKGGSTAAPASAEGGKGEGAAKPADGAKTGDSAAKPAEGGSSPAKSDAPAVAPAPAPAPAPSTK
ncbi:MAG: regulatory protein FmdB family [Ramlibacter sp.]|nr:regulatory protein FmdB family [Ramlibacter sp.]